MPDNQESSLFKDWDSLAEDVLKMGGLASYKLDVLISIYGVNQATVTAAKDIKNSLKRRGLVTYPENLEGKDPEIWVRVYKMDSQMGEFIKAALDPRPKANEILRKLEKEFVRSEGMRQLLIAARRVSQD